MEKELEACKLWVMRDFSLIPTALIEKAYFENGKCGEEIEVLAPIEEDVPLIPAWGYVFVPDNSLDEEWIKRNAERVAEECGFIVYYTNEVGVYLGVNGAGYDFYEHHWLPLYRLRGLKWHLEG